MGSDYSDFAIVFRGCPQDVLTIPNHGITSASDARRLVITVAGDSQRSFFSSEVVTSRCPLFSVSWCQHASAYAGWLAGECCRARPVLLALRTNLAAFCAHQPLHFFILALHQRIILSVPLLSVLTCCAG